MSKKKRARISLIPQFLYWRGIKPSSSRRICWNNGSSSLSWKDLYWCVNPCWWAFQNCQASVAVTLIMSRKVTLIGPNSDRDILLPQLVAPSLVTSMCMHGQKRKPTVTNRAFRNFLRNRSEWQKEVNPWNKGIQSWLAKDSASWHKAVPLHWLHAAEDVLRAGVTLLTIMRAGARFTVSPFKLVR